ncbi:MAG: 4'-phosphopantetheinyl transferase family protein [Isosphaeraceae bacterium]
METAGEPEDENEALAPPILSDWHPGGLAAELAPHETRAWVIDLDAGLNPAADQDALEADAERAILNADEQARADRFVRPRDRRRFVRCRAALREILGQLLTIRATSVRFRAAGHGKPELDWEAMGGADVAIRPALEFNVSHSAGLGLVAVCRGSPLGVDVEKVRPISEAERIVASYFTPAEVAAFNSISAEDRAMAFLRGWTRKEAILKGLGIGLAGLATHYETWFGTNGLTSRFAVATPLFRVGDWQLWETTPRPGYVAALAIHELRQGHAALDQPIARQRVVATPGHESVD